MSFFNPIISLRPTINSLQPGLINTNLSRLSKQCDVICFLALHQAFGRFDARRILSRVLGWLTSLEDATAATELPAAYKRTETPIGLASQNPDEFTDVAADLEGF